MDGCEGLERRPFYAFVILLHVHIKLSVNTAVNWCKKYSSQLMQFSTVTTVLLSGLEMSKCYHPGFLKFHHRNITEFY